MDGPIASFVSGYSLLIACAMIWDAVWRNAPFPFSSLNVRIFSSQSLSTIVLKSTTSPSSSPDVATRASPSLMSSAMSYTLIGWSYSLNEPSFSVIFMFFLFLSPFSESISSVFLRLDWTFLRRAWQSDTGHLPSAVSVFSARCGEKERHSLRNASYDLNL